MVVCNSINDGSTNVRPRKMWVLLTDIAHNCLAWLARYLLADSPFACLWLLAR